MSYTFQPLTFGDVADVLREISGRDDLRVRLERQFVSHLWWAVDRGQRSYLFGFDGQLEFEGSGYLLFFRGEFFELKQEFVGNRVAFYKPPRLFSSTLAEVQGAFSAAISVYGRGVPGPRDPMADVRPIFVDSYEELWNERPSV